jgi:AAHS family 4-hydroxybenzoate transporter-like MFS transporter
MTASASQNTYDVTAILDQGTWSGTQKMAVILAALAIILDGFDGQLIGFAIPVLIKDWGLSSSSFAPVLAAGLVGMATGSVLGGYIGDRYGRRVALIFSVFLFGVTTSCIGLAPNLLTLGLLRFIAGLGIGGTLPAASTIAAEFTPMRSRAVSVTATIVCFPLGGMLAGFFSAYVLPNFGWRALFLCGGAIPVLFAVVLMVVIPESPRYLARHSKRWSELASLLQRFGTRTEPNAHFTDGTDQRSAGGVADQKPGFGRLLEGSMARDTVALWVAFFCCLFAIYSAFSWLPTVLTTAGFSPQVAGAGLTAYNLGGVFGALGCAQLIARFGSRWPMIICAAGGAAMALLLKLVPNDQTNLLVFGLGLHGLFVNAVNCTLYAASAFLYPTYIRATGTATALAVGRFGAILSSFTGAALIAYSGPSAFLTFLGLAMIAVASALAVLRTHIPASLPSTLKVGTAPGR